MERTEGPREATDTIVNEDEEIPSKLAHRLPRPSYKRMQAIKTYAPGSATSPDHGSRGLSARRITSS